ncbi:MAG: hypothetical protein JNL21_07365 [Myxococcales bacterium]|nr:hypothetical protein [Myxococcales bacterium]
MARALLLLVIATSAMACAPPAPAALPEPPMAPDLRDLVPAGSLPPAEDEDPGEGEDPSRPIPSVWPAPASCGGAPATLRARRRCPATTEGALLAIDNARVQPEEEQDRALADLEGCQVIETTAIRALRAELAPPECRDLLAEPLLASAGPGARALLRAQTIEGRLARVASGAPPVPFDGFAQFAEKKLEPWLTERERLADELAAAGPSSGVPGAIVMLAHGKALYALAKVARTSLADVPACKGARFGRHGRITVERCHPQLEGPGKTAASVASLAKMLEERSAALLAKGLADYPDGAVFSDRVTGGALVELRPRREPPATDSAAQPASLDLAPGVRTRLARRLPGVVAPLLLER